MVLHRSPLVRLATLLLFLALALLLFNTLEPRRTAYSCRTFWSCIGVGTRHAYIHPLPASSPSLVSEVVLRDGTTRYDRLVPDADPHLLFLALNRDATSWSSDFRSTQRTVHDFLDLLVSTRLNLTDTSLALLTSSADEYRLLKTATESLPFARTTLFLRPDLEPGIPYEDRHSHSPELQLARRSALAALRNYLMLRALQDEAHLLWLDADVVALSPAIVQTMLAHSAATPDAGIITAACHQNRMDNYDKNAWKLASPSAPGSDAVPDADRAAAALRDLLATRRMVPDLIRDTDDAALVPLDSVGGTILYLRADLVRRGLAFPPFNLVGTTWARPGWIGVETEGLCYAARALGGGAGCYVLGGSHHVRHSDWG